MWNFDITERTRECVKDADRLHEFVMGMIVDIIGGDRCDQYDWLSVLNLWGYL